MGDAQGVVAQAERLVHGAYRRRVRGVAVEGAAVGVGALLVAAIVLRLWRARWGESFSYESDASYYLMLVRALGQSGSYMNNAHLGWPLGQHLAAYPEGGDNLHWLILSGLVRATGSVGVAVNVFYVATFGIVAAVAHVVLRVMGVTRTTAGAMALLYAFVPYHTARNETHLMLASYATIPIVVCLTISIMGGDPIVLGPVSGGVAWRQRRTWLYGLVAVVVASTGSYYFVFSMLLLAIGAIVGALSHRSWRPAVGAALLAGLATVVYTANLAPSLLERFRHPARFVVSARVPSETDRWGLRIAELFLPRANHRLGVLARIAAVSARHSVLPSEGGQQLGIVFALGLVAALGAVAFRAAAPTIREGRTSRQLARVGILAAVCMMTGAIGSLSFITSLAGLRPIRAWNRISIVIAFCAAVACAVVVDRVRHRLNQGPRRYRILALVLPGAVLISGLADQTANADVPAYASVHGRYRSDRDFYATVARHLAAGSAVFEFPDVAFPEHAHLGTGPYDEARGYIFQPDLAWSFGYLRTNHPDWAATLDQQPAAQWLTTIIAVGFRAVVIDRAGYLDHAASLEHDLTTTQGPPIAISTDHRYSFYDITTYATRVRHELGSQALTDRRHQALTVSVG